jgi:hypothetical protein
MEFPAPTFIEFYRTHGIKVMPTGPRTPWPNRAESAARLFKRMFTLLVKEAQLDPKTATVTVQDLVRERVWARNTQQTISGRAPLELAFGRRLPDLLGVETMDPEQLTTDPLPPDLTTRELRRLAMQSHLKARQADDLRHDLASRILPSEGPFAPGQHVFYWDKDASKIKSQ